MAKKERSVSKIQKKQVDVSEDLLQKIDLIAGAKKSKRTTVLDELLRPAVEEEFVRSMAKVGLAPKDSSK